MAICTIRWEPSWKPGKNVTSIPRVVVPNKSMTNWQSEFNLFGTPPLLPQTTHRWYFPIPQWWWTTQCIIITTLPKTNWRWSHHKNKSSSRQVPKSFFVEDPTTPSTMARNGPIRTTHEDEKGDGTCVFLLLQTWRKQLQHHTKTHTGTDTCAFQV